MASILHYLNAKDLYFQSKSPAFDLTKINAAIWRHYGTTGQYIVTPVCITQLLTRSKWPWHKFELVS